MSVLDLKAHAFVGQLPSNVSCLCLSVMKPNRSSPSWRGIKPSPPAESLQDLMMWPVWICTRLIGFPSEPAEPPSASCSTLSPQKRQRKSKKQQEAQVEFGGAEAEASRQLRFVRLMQHWMGMMFFSTDYSGVDTPRWCFHAVFRVLSEAFSTTDERVQFIRSCDRGSKQSDVLTSIGQEHNTCHQGDMLSRLPMEAREMIRSALPDADAPLDERVKANHWIEQWMVDNRQWVFSKEAKFKCKVHGRDCYAHPCMHLRADQPLNSVIFCLLRPCTSRLRLVTSHLGHPTSHLSVSLQYTVGS